MWFSNSEENLARNQNYREFQPDLIGWFWCHSMDNARCCWKTGHFCILVWRKGLRGNLWTCGELHWIPLHWVREADFPASFRRPTFYAQLLITCIKCHLDCYISISLIKCISSFSCVFTISLPPIIDCQHVISHCCHIPSWNEYKLNCRVQWLCLAFCSSSVLGSPKVVNDSGISLLCIPGLLTTMKALILLLGSFA